MLPSEGFTGDGTTTFDGLVQHPYEPRAFRPEITLILDIATRKCVGVSIDTSKTGISQFWDAFRVACITHASRIFSIQNTGRGTQRHVYQRRYGGPDTARVISKTSIPGRPQGKGLMERRSRPSIPIWRNGSAFLRASGHGSGHGPDFRLSVNTDIKNTENQNSCPTFGVFFEMHCASALTSTTPRPTRPSRSLRTRTASGGTIRPANTGT